MYKGKMVRIKYVTQITVANTNICFLLQSASVREGSLQAILGEPHPVGIRAVGCDNPFVFPGKIGFPSLRAQPLLQR